MGTPSSGTGIYTELSTLLALRFPARNLKLFSRLPAGSQLLGETRSRFRGRGMEFEEVRLYQPGDDIRAIDWRVTARTGEPHTKLFREERERPVHLLVDQRSSMYFGSTTRFKSVLAAELAALIGWAALDNSDRIGGQILGDRQEVDIRARRNRQAILQLLHHLDEFNHRLPADQPGTRSLADSLESCRRLTRPGSALFVISDFLDMDEPAERALRLLSRHADIRLLQVRDPLELELPALGKTLLSDGRKPQQVHLDAGLVRVYQQAVAKRQQQLTRLARLCYAPLINALTSESPVDILRRAYGSRSR